MSRVIVEKIKMTIGTVSEQILPVNGKREWMQIQVLGPGSVRIAPGDDAADDDDFLMAPRDMYEPFIAPITAMQAKATEASTKIVIWVGEKGALPS